MTHSFAITHARIKKEEKTLIEEEKETQEIQLYWTWCFRQGSSQPTITGTRMKINFDFKPLSKNLTTAKQHKLGQTEGLATS